MTTFDVHHNDNQLCEHCVEAVALAVALAVILAGAYALARAVLGWRR